ncbi:MAG: tRNA (adenosine(37)-N6)-dimethylallyltransferase MiaA [Bacteroidota bacterium]
MLKENKLIVIGGPTASGKTTLSIDLSRHFNAPILSCDSRQFFREMNIGTAKPSSEELAQAPHHFINSLSIQDEYNVGTFERDALNCLTHIYQQSSTAILVGGSGLYIQAVCDGLDVFPNVPRSIRDEVQKQYNQQGIQALQTELQRLDPVYFAQVDQYNPHRLIRAISVCRASGQAFSSFFKQAKSTRPFEPIFILLEWERAKLYERINLRVDQMMEHGLLEEARQLFPFKQQTALQTVGYQELFQYFEGMISLEEAIELIKRNSRRYAKRQMTWFRRDRRWIAFDASNSTDILNFLEQKM